MTITSITKLPSGKTGATITSNLDELAILRGLVVNALRHMPDVGETTSTRQRLKAMSRVLHRVYTVDQLVHIDTTAPDYKSKCDALSHQLKDAKWKSTSWVHGRADKRTVETLYDLLNIQGQNGNWNCNSYMMGLYNGIECAIATLESREPRYRHKPETGWLDDKLPNGLDYAPVATLDAEQEGKLRAAIDAASKLKNPPAVFAEYTGKHWSIEKATATGCAAILSGMPDRFTFQEFADRVVKSGLTTDHEAREILVSLVNGSREWMTDSVERTVVKKVGVVHRRPLHNILDGITRPFARTHFIDEALDHGYTVDEATKWLTEWLKRNPEYELDAATDTVHWRGVRPNYGGRPVVCGPTVLPLSDQKSLMEILSEMPGEFTFAQFYIRVLHALKSVNAAMHGNVTKDAETQLHDECYDFLMRLPRNVFEVDKVCGSVKRRGSVVVVDPKSIPNPDYVSPAVVAKLAPLDLIFRNVSKTKGILFEQDHFIKEAINSGYTPKQARDFLDVKLGPLVPTPAPHPDNSTASVSEEDKGQETTPKAPNHRTTLFEVYERINECFTFETIASLAAKHGHDRLKVSAFVSLMCKIGSLRQPNPNFYEKLSNVRESEIRHLASLIA